METLYFFISAHGTSTIDEDGDFQFTTVPNNTTVMLSAYCGNAIQVENLDPRFFYRSSYIHGSQFLLNLQAGILPVLSKYKRRRTADFEISQYAMNVYKSGQDFVDVDLLFKPTYEDYAVGRYGGYFKCGIFRLPLIDDTPTNCDYNKDEFFYRPYNCNCRDIPCEFDIDENNNLMVDGKRKDFYYSSHRAFRQQSKPQILEWAKSSSIYTDEILLANGARINEGNIEIKLSNILNLLTRDNPDKNIVVISTACRVFDTSLSNKFLTEIARKSQYTSKFDIYVVDLISIILEFTDIPELEEIKTSMTEFLHLDRTSQHELIEHALYLVELFDLFLCDNPQLFSPKKIEILRIKIDRFNSTLSAELFSDQIVGKHYRQTDIYDDEVFKLECL
jgi:hypothetical protein